MLSLLLLIVSAEALRFQQSNVKAQKELDEFAKSVIKNKDATVAKSVIKNKGATAALKKPKVEADGKEADSKAMDSKAMDSSERVMRKIAKGKDHAWITFLGDSNMRNTYWWWVTSKLNKTGVILHKGKDFTYSRGYAAFVARDPHLNSQWADQEAVLEFPDGFQVRTSFRFLHGSETEFKFKTKEWHKASRSGMDSATFSGDKEFKKMQLTAADVMQMDDPDAIAPSQYAQWATKKRQLIDFSKDLPFLAKNSEKYENSKPDAVILTEGWGGNPGCQKFDEVVSLFKKNPEVKFTWSPVYMTNRVKSRHDCFSQKIDTLPKDGKQNFKFVDMWDLAKETPMKHTARGQEDTKHMKMGGKYMLEAVTRLENAISDLAN